MGTCEYRDRQEKYKGGICGADSLPVIVSNYVNKQ